MSEKGDAPFYRAIRKGICPCKFAIYLLRDYGFLIK